MNAAPRTILVVHEGRHGPTATQKISFAQPFAKPDEDAPVHVLFEHDRVEPALIRDTFAKRRADLLVLSRYTSERGTDWIAAARDAGIPVIFHVDDDLLAVPPSLGAAKHNAYNSPERLAALRHNIESSDLLYASTTELGRRFGEHGIQAPIIAGDIYCSVAPEDIGGLIGPATGPVIGYMGTSGHAADLAMTIPAVCAVMEAVPSLQFEVFGTIAMPSELLRFGRRVRHLPPVADYADFLPRLRSLGWWIGLAPLEDNVFNRCKADTKWVEYSLAGMAVVASDLPVYHRACAGGAGILAAGLADWTEALRTLIHRPDIRMSMIGAAQRKLRESYSHESLRRQILDVFDRASLRPLPQVASAGGQPQPAH